MSATLLTIGAGLLARDINGYTGIEAAQKSAFHADGKRFLRALATALEFAPGTFEIRSNLGGMAVSGEVTLHHERLYVQLFESCTGLGVEVLYRTCAGRQDYTGGTNQFVSMTQLETAEGQAKFLAQCQYLLRSLPHGSRSGRAIAAS